MDFYRVPRALGLVSLHIINLTRISCQYKLPTSIEKCFIVCIVVFKGINLYSWLLFPPKYFSYSSIWKKFRKSELSERLLSHPPS